MHEAIKQTFSSDVNDLLVLVDKSLTIWEVRSPPEFSEPREYIIPEEFDSIDIAAMDWSPNSHIVAFGMKSGLLILWNKENETTNFQESLFESPLMRVHFSSDGCFTGSFSSDLKVEVFQLSECKLKAIENISSPPEITEINIVDEEKVEIDEERFFSVIDWLKEVNNDLPERLQQLYTNSLFELSRASVSMENSVFTKRIWIAVNQFIELQPVAIGIMMIHHTYIPLLDEQLSQYSDFEKLILATEPPYHPLSKKIKNLTWLLT
jgi:hypothetical protein